MTEAAIQKAILEMAELMPGIKVWRQNTGAARYVDKRGKPRFVRFGMPGSADLTGLVLPSGRRIEIEVKAPGGKLTQAQEAFGLGIEKAGGIYWVVRSVDDFRDRVESLGPKRET